MLIIVQNQATNKWLQEEAKVWEILVKPNEITFKTSYSLHFLLTVTHRQGRERFSPNHWAQKHFSPTEYLLPSMGIRTLTLSAGD